MTAEAPGYTGRLTRVRSPELLVVTVGLALVLGVALRFVVGGDLPLWFDETWTGAIVGQETLAATIEQVLLDANGPLYFVLMHAWTNIFGLSDAALRLPSFVSGALVPFVALIATRGMDRPVQLIWCGLLALWIPALWYAQEARCYSLVLLLATGCTVAYVRLMAQPTARAAVVWASLATLAILTQYHALILVGCQGLAYLAHHRGRALRTWPAPLLFLPAAAWLAVHRSRLSEYARSDAGWQPRLELEHAPEIVDFVVGDIRLAAILVLLAAVAVYLVWRDRPHASPRPDAQSFVWLAVAAAVAGALVTIGVGIAVPSFTTRYLMPFMPGILLGVALVVAALGRRWAMVSVGAVLLYALFASVWAGERSQSGGKSFNFEGASRALMTSDPDHLVFLWDNPLLGVLAPSQLQAVGGFFFRREGRVIPVTPVILHPGDDPSQRLLAVAGARSAILWIYDTAVQGTAAASRAPRIEDLDGDWTCRDHGRGSFGVVACYRAPAAPVRHGGD
jgi:uncharacterized membrane protein